MRPGHSSRNFPRFAAALAIAWATSLLSPASVSAQSDAQLTGAEIVRLVSGKTVIVRSDRGIRGSADRPEFFTRTDGGWVELHYVCRGDGSYRRLCPAAYDGKGPTNCRGPFGAVGTGVWLVQGNSFCLRDLVARASEPICYGIARAGTRYSFHYVSGGIPAGDFRGYLDRLEFEVRQ